MDGFSDDWEPVNFSGILAVLLLGCLVYSDVVYAGARSWGYWKGMEIEGDHALISLYLTRVPRSNKMLWALGTTLKQAGSKEKQYEIGYSLNYNFAQIAKNNGVRNYALVSSVGANAKSGIFYTRIKGELDEAVAKLGFENVAILRPASLT